MTADGGAGSSAPDVLAGPPADPESVARTICLRLLDRAPRTRAQLQLALTRRNVPGEAAAAVLDRLEEVGLIDDAAYAAAWVQTRHSGRGLARRALAAELRSRGIDGEQAAEALAQLDPEVERARAEELVRRRLSATGGLTGPARERRLVGLLARKGYPAGLAVQVVREVVAEEGGEEDAWSGDGAYGGPA